MLLVLRRRGGCCSRPVLRVSAPAVAPLPSSSWRPLHPDHAPSTSALALEAVRGASASIFRGTSMLYSGKAPPRHQQRHGRNAADVDEDDEDLSAFEVEVTASITKDAREFAQANSIDELVKQTLPPGAGTEATNALRAYFTAKPINSCIKADRVIITHVADADGRDAKATGFAPMSIEEALQTAKDNELDLVQFGSKQDGASTVVYCRLRREVEAALASIAHLVTASAGGGDGTGNKMAAAAAAPKFELREQEIVSFSDRADAHFISWRSIKIVQSLQRRHPTRLVIEKFGNPVTAVKKMREMLVAIEKHGKDMKVAHHHTGISTSPRELIVTLSPSAPSAKSAEGIVVKHPSEKDWERALARLHELTGGKGTVVVDNRLKMRNIGLTTFRKDKFGRRIE